MEQCVLFELENKEKLGWLDAEGNRRVVEIDESLFKKRKYNRGRVTDGFWVVGGIERGTKRSFFEKVERKDADTLRRVINNDVLPESIVITDEWAAYPPASLNMPLIEHRTINHTENFVDPNDPEIHTQTVVNLSSRVKELVRRKKGILRESYILHMTDFLWRQRHPNHKYFNEILILFNKF